MEEARLQLWKTSDKIVTKVYFTVRSQGIMHSVIHPQSSAILLQASL